MCKRGVKLTKNGWEKWFTVCIYGKYTSVLYTASTYGDFYNCCILRTVISVLLFFYTDSRHKKRCQRCQENNVVLIRVELMSRIVHEHVFNISCNEFNTIITFNHLLTSVVTTW